MPLQGPDTEAAPLSIESLARRFGMRAATVVLAAALILAATACGGGEATGGSSGGAADGSGKQQSSQKAEESAPGAAQETTAAGGAVPSGEAAELARAEVGEREIRNMLPAGGEKPDPARPLPEDPPEGIEVYPATTNRTLKGPIEYDRQPPTNGDHDPLWQNCGFYERPIKDRHAVHSLDHGVVWITHRPDLPAGRVEALRPYGEERYVIVSPYPGQEAPVIATSWRVQLELDGAKDPRLRRFVDQFRISELSPLSGNRCSLGVGDPKG